MPSAKPEHQQATCTWTLPRSYWIHDVVVAMIYVLLEVLQPFSTIMLSRQVRDEVERARAGGACHWCSSRAWCHGRVPTEAQQPGVATVSECARHRCAIEHESLACAGIFSHRLEADGRVDPGVALPRPAESIELANGEISLSAIREISRVLVKWARQEIDRCCA